MPSPPIVEEIQFLLLGHEYFGMSRQIAMKASSACFGSADYKQVWKGRLVSHCLRFPAATLFAVEATSEVGLSLLASEVNICQNHLLSFVRLLA